MFLNLWSHIFYFLELETIAIAVVNSTVKHIFHALVISNMQCTTCICTL